MNQFNLSTLATSAGVLGLVKALQGLVTGLRNVATQSLQNYAHFESMQKGLETFFQSAEKGKSTFETLRKLSNETTFGVDELAGSFTQLANVGVAVDTINDKLMMLGNLSQGDKQKFADLVSIYSKVMSTGKAGSMQLQQFAMRGLPIYDVLKKMGVQGQATGKQITEAFKQMTQEGGQFYNAMNNINDTIVGKQGFISDYFKEMMVNLADVSGLAEMYKSVLDTVREAIGKVSDKLKEWNDNPVAKAIFQGVLYSSLLAIVGVITGMLIPALASVLSLLIAINPAMAIGAGIGAVIGIATGGAITIKGLLKEIKGDSKDIADEYKNAVGSAPASASAVDTSEYDTNKIRVLMKKVEEAKKDIEHEYGKLNSADNYFLKITQGYEEGTKSIDDYNKALERKKRILKNIEELEEKVEQYNKQIEELIPSAQAEQEFKAWRELLDGYKKSISEAWDSSDFSKTEAKIKELETSAKSLHEILDFANKSQANKDYLGSEYIQKATDMLHNFENELRKLNGLAEQKTWREYWKEVTGAQIGNNEIKGMNGEKIGNITVDQLREKYDKQASAENSKSDKAALYRSFAKEVKGMIKTLLSKTGLSDEEFKANDNSINGLKDFAKELETTADSLDGFSTGVLGLADKLKEQGKEKIQAGDTSGYVDYAKGAFLGAAGDAVSGTDAGTFLQSWAQTGNVFIAIIETVIGGLFKVITSIENWDEGLNGVQDFFERLKPILEILIRFAQDIIEGVDGVLDIINVIVAVLTPFLNFFRVLSKIVIAPLKILGYLFRELARTIEKLLKPLIELVDEWLGDIDDWYDELDADKYKEEEKEQAKDLTDQYKALIQAMKEQEEYYEKRKTELNAQAYNSNVTGVHDMILTPQGNFSTDPDDYIFAMKNPKSLVGSGASVVAVRPIINNTFADKTDVNVSTQENDEGGVDIFVQISEKVAQDYATGSNGWDSAVSYRNYKAQGRSVLV